MNRRSMIRRVLGAVAAAFGVSGVRPARTVHVMGADGLVYRGVRVPPVKEMPDFNPRKCAEVAIRNGWIST